MNEEFEKNLHNKYKNLFPNKIHIDCHNGWFPLIDNLCEKIQKVCNRSAVRVNVHQVKTKFGVLRFYYSFDYKNNNKYWYNLLELKLDNKIRRGLFVTPYENVFNLVKEAEKKSSRTCEACGKDTAFTSGKICVVTLCPGCLKEFLKDPIKNQKFN